MSDGPPALLEQTEVGNVCTGREPGAPLLSDGPPLDAGAGESGGHVHRDAGCVFAHLISILFLFYFGLHRANIRRVCEPCGRGSLMLW